MRNIQIGVMGSAQDLKYSKQAEDFAKELGKLIAKENAVLVYGAEKDCCSLSTITAKSAKDSGGTTLAITYGKGKEVWGGKDYQPSIVVPCGLERGGGREFVLGLSCDVIIAISGGSGTLNEIAVAYQANIPIVVVNIFGGWANKLNNKFLDERNRQMCYGVSTPEEAIKKAMQLIEDLK